MLASNMKEAQTQIVDLTDSSPCTVKAALCFIYTGEIQDDTDFHKLLSFAHKYEVEELIKFSAKTLANDVSTENVCNAVASLRQLTDHREVEASFQALLREIQDDHALLEAVARKL
eukprot:gnl/MRDRNA2_/MRDRNA2_122061_c0_seq1.p1 gnl/MRDRNA2_/MRDRNA2_122061_c0~~gnl/MRDRNA2_/MRDRNA2_122061_c0_seq1.p1  ORF type:complete len:116 (+),score=25.27 gnl/MRDRNA2_/MRDRNA2_122061_c0_seq1:237-584(+)